MIILCFSSPSITVSRENAHQAIWIVLRYGFVAIIVAANVIASGTDNCEPVLRGNVTQTFQPVFKYNPSIHVPFRAFHVMKETNYRSYSSKRTVQVLHQIVNDPMSTFSVFEPGHVGSCRKDSGIMVPAKETARRHNCIYASNAGFYNSFTGQCYGNIASNGKLVQSSGGIQNVHFGITKDRKLFVGYLSEEDFLTRGFTQLVGGVIWLVKDGKNFINESLKMECPKITETDNIAKLANVISGRAAVGYDAKGKVHMVQVNGWTDHEGISLHGLADLLIQMGVTNAINLDGGGSTTTIINDTLVSFPYDHCGGLNTCDRPVSTILCVHYPECSPRDCSNNGACINGQCHCREPWTGNGCDVIDGNVCGAKGIWNVGACHCEPGWHGVNCSQPCPPGMYGHNCSRHCLCGLHGDCDPQTEECRCHPGFIGEFCHQECPHGFYGDLCLDVCSCENSKICDHITGNCSNSTTGESNRNADQGLLQGVRQKDQIVSDDQDHYSLGPTSSACLLAIAIASLSLNIFFFTKWRQSENPDPVLDGMEQSKTKRWKRKDKKQSSKIHS